MFEYDNYLECVYILRSNDTMVLLCNNQREDGVFIRSFPAFLFFYCFVNCIREIILSVVWPGRMVAVTWFAFVVYYVFWYVGSGFMRYTEAHDFYISQVLQDVSTCCMLSLISMLL